MKLLWLCLLCLVTLPCLANTLEANFGAQELANKLKAEKLCGSNSSAILCRSLPWIPTQGEGVIEIETKVYFFLRVDRQSPKFKELLAKIAPEKQDQMSTFLAFALSKLKVNGLAGGFGGIFLVWMNQVNGELLPVSFFSIGYNNYTKFMSAASEKMVSELEASAGSWYPSEGFIPEYDYKKLP